MLKQQSVQVVSQTTELKKTKTFERNHTFYYKRKSLVKKIQELTEQYDQEIYLCVHDKKTGKIFEYSSDSLKFNLDQVNTVVMKKKQNEKEQSTAPPKDISCLNDENIDQASIDVIEEPNESTTESKKNTNASSSGVSDGKSDHSLNPTDMKEHDIMDLRNMDTSYPLQFDYEINHLKESNAQQMQMFQAKVNSVLQTYPENLSHCDLSCNDLSHPIENCRPSLFIDCKMDSISTENVLDHHFQEEKSGDKIDNMTHFQRRGDYDEGLNVLDQRNDFAQKYLFAGGQNNQAQDQYQELMDDGIYSAGDESYYSDDESNISAYDQVYDPNMADQVANQNQHHLQRQLSGFHDQNQQANYTESVQDYSVANSPNDKTHDMFFACCDWENLRTADKPEEEVVVSKFEDDDEHAQSEPKGCKHKAKFASKSGMISHSPEVTVTEFATEEASIDIDSIIKKVSTGNMSERIVSKRMQSSKQLKRLNKKKAQVCSSGEASQASSSHQSEDCSSSHKNSDDGSKSSQQSMSSPSKHFKCNTKEQLQEMRACLSPMADNNRRTVYDSSPITSSAKNSNVNYKI